jgi:hypothetical protein
LADPPESTPGDTGRRDVHIANRRARAAYCYIASLTPVRLTNGQDWEGYQDGADCTPDKAASYRADMPAVQVTVRRWQDSDAGWQQMRQARRFVDRPPGVAQATYSDAEELNRRVDISVLSAGSCSATAAPTPVPTPALNSPGEPSSTAPAPAAMSVDDAGRIALTGAGEPPAAVTGG